MKIYFYTDTPSGKAAMKGRVKKGYGGGVISQIAQAFEDGKPGKMVQSGFVRIEEKKSAKLDKKQLQERNDAEWEKVVALGEYLPKVESIFSRTNEMFTIFSQIRAEHEEAKSSSSVAIVESSRRTHLYQVGCLLNTPMMSCPEPT